MKKTTFIFLLFIIAIAQTKSPNINLNTALEQINAKAIIKSGLTGKNIKIGIIDAGFKDAIYWDEIKEIYRSNRIKFTKNYVSTAQYDFFNDILSNHGSWVFNFIGGKDKNKYEGLATKAEFYLARTEYGSKDYHEEEVLLGKALDDFFNMGIRLVNISVGYTDKFKHKSERYNPKDMNGNTTYVSKICKKYADKGMIIIVTAGNEGNWWDFWKGYINAPADVENVITVGATQSHIVPWNTHLNGKEILKNNYSGKGPEFLNYVKPDVVCYSDRGCSFSTPIITGLIATMLEKDSSLTLKQVKDLLYKSSTLYPYPNNYIGYGVPDAEKILLLLENPKLTLDTAKKLEIEKSKCEIFTESNNIVLFYKKNKYNVIKQKKVKSKNGKLVVKKKGAKRTTVVIENKDVYEIIWGNNNFKENL